MGARTRRAAQLRADVQARVPEHLLAAGRVTAAVAPTTARDGSAGPADPSSRFPPDVWVAVSRNRIYAFAAGDDGVGDLAGVWDRSDTTVSKVERLTVTTLQLRIGASGRRLELDARRFRAGARELVRLLLDPTRDG